nr:polyprenol phosphomannose-dependent alpha 1,6 mannosyltransferase MptB [Kibdelosporangium phytohabitans]
MGLAGSVLIALGAFGAGATLLRDPLSGTPFAAWGYGHGRMVATAVLYLGIGVLVWAWIRAARMDARGMARATAVWSAPLLFAPPLFSTDLYTYLAQGAVADAGFNPYRTVPAEVPGPISDNAAGQWLFVPSPYGPLFIGLMRSVVSVTGTDLVAASVLARLVVVSGLWLLCLALPRLCRHLGARPRFALWIGVANPLVLLYLVGGAHNDLLMIGLMVTGAVLVLDHAPVRGFAVLTAAVAVKVAAVVALPFLVWVWAANRVPGRRVTVGGFVGVATAAVSIVVAVFGVCTVLAGVDLGWIGALDGNTGLEPWLSVPTALGKITSAVVDVDHARLITGFRVVGSGVLAGLVVWLWWRSRAGGAVALRGAALALLATVLLAPVVFPWYFTWPLAFGAAVGWQVSRIAVAGAVSMWLALSSHPDGRTLLPVWGFAAAFVFCLAVGIVLAYAGPDTPAPQRTGQRILGSVT